MRRTASNVVLAIGFLAVAVGVAIAWNSPASAYEPSIYTGTPVEAWAAFAVAIAIAAGTTIAARGRDQTLGIALGATGVTAIVSLPVIRNYRYIGLGDGMTHLGWVRDIVNGTTAPQELFYPGLHSVAGLLHLLGGVPVERSIMLAVVFLFVPFLVFVPLAVREMSGSAAAVGFAAIVSWLVLPINHVATHMGAHTNSNALFLAPVALFAIVAFLGRRSEIERLPAGVSPYTGLAVLVGIGLLFVHPQQMINVVVILAAITLVQFVARRRYDDHPIADHASAFGLTVVLGGAFAIWVGSRPLFRDAVSGLVFGLLESDVGAESEVGQRETSLAEIGGSLPELFAKLFLVSAVIGLLVGLFVLLTWLGRTSLERETRAYVNYLAIALIPLTAIFGLYFLGTPQMAFRQAGFVYVLITILAGFALASGTGWLGGWITRPGANVVTAAVLGALLVFSLATLFASPFIYSPSQHASDQTMSGYETAFEHGDGDVPYAGFGFEVTRYGHGILGVDESAEREFGATGNGTVDPDAFEAGNYDEAYRDGNYYFVVTSWDEERELDVYRELYHSRESLEGVEEYPGANKVVSNDDFRMYRVSDAE